MDTLLCMKLVQPNAIGLAIRYSEDRDRPTATAFVKVVRSLIKNQYPLLESSQLTTALCEGLLGSRVKHKLDKAVEDLPMLDTLDNPLTKRIATMIYAQTSKGVSSDQVALQVGGMDYPLLLARANGVQMELAASWLSTTAQFGSGAAINDDLATRVLWKELLQWQSMYFDANPSKDITRFIDRTQTTLAQGLIGRVSDPGRALEHYVLLESLKYPRDSVSFRISLPNLEIIDDNGRTTNEYDVVTIVLRDNKDVEVWVWGVTVEQNINAKRREDILKIQKLDRLLHDRWGNDLKVVQNYVYKDGPEICCTIDGTETRRLIASPGVNVTQAIGVR